MDSMKKKIAYLLLLLMLIPVGQGETYVRDQGRSFLCKREGNPDPLG